MSMPVLYPPSRLDPAINAEVSKAAPCPGCYAPNKDLWPMMSTIPPHNYAIGCYVCGFISHDAPTVAEAVTLWNDDEERTGGNA
jgi:hypothetical protein